MYKEEQDTKTRDWDMFFFLNSDHSIASELLKLFEEGRSEELRNGLLMLQKEGKYRDKQELEDELIELMQLIILWKISSNFRTDTLRSDINFWRHMLEQALEREYVLTKDILEELWESAFDSAKYKASRFILEAYDSQILTWDEVFNTHYPPEDGK